MPGNTSPIFSKVARVEWASGITAANSAKDGTGTVDTVFTADATNGSYLQKLGVRPRGTNVASVLRVFLNNGASNATAANNVLIAELSLPATTLSEVAAERCRASSSRRLCCREHCSSRQVRAARVAWRGPPPASRWCRLRRRQVAWPVPVAAGQVVLARGARLARQGLPALSPVAALIRLWAAM